MQSPPGFSRKVSKNGNISNYILELQDFRLDKTHNNTNLLNLYRSLFSSISSKNLSIVNENIVNLLHILPSTLPLYQYQYHDLCNSLFEQYILLINFCLSRYNILTNLELDYFQHISSLIQIISFYRNNNNSKLFTIALRNLTKLFTSFSHKINDKTKRDPFHANDISKISKTVYETILPYICFDEKDNSIKTIINNNSQRTLHRLSVRILSCCLDIISDPSFSFPNSFQIIFSLLLYYINVKEICHTKSLISILNAFHTYIIKAPAVVEDQMISIISALQKILQYNDKHYTYNSIRAIHPVNEEKSDYYETDPFEDTSDTSFSQEDILNQDRARDSHYSTQVRLFVLKCLLELSKKCKKAFFEYWYPLLPASTSSFNLIETSFSISGPTLFTSMLYDSSSHVRNTATSVLCSIMENSPFCKWKELMHNSSLPALPSNICSSLISIHHCLFYSLKQHYNDINIYLSIFKSFNVFFSTAPYHYIVDSNLHISELVEFLVKKFSLGVPSFNNIILPLLSSILSAKPVDIEEWLLSKASHPTFVEWLLEQFSLQLFSKQTTDQQSLNVFSDITNILSILIQNYPRIVFLYSLSLYKLIIDGLNTNSIRSKLHSTRLLEDWLSLQDDSVGDFFSTFRILQSFNLLFSFIPFDIDQNFDTSDISFFSKVFSCISFLLSAKIDEERIFSKNLESLTSTLLRSMQSKHHSIRTSSINTAGIFIKYLSFICDKAKIQVFLNSFLCSLSDKNSLTRIHGSVSIANYFSFLPHAVNLYGKERSYSLICELLNTLNDNEKVSSNSIRTIGYIFAQLLSCENVSEKEIHLLSETIKYFLNYLDSKIPLKIQWNICFSLKIILQTPFFNSFSNQTQYNLLIEPINSFVNKCFEFINSPVFKNFKLKIAASNALLSIRSLQLFGASSHLLYFFESLLSMIDNYKTKNDNHSFLVSKYSTQLYESLLNLSKHLFELLQKSNTYINTSDYNIIVSKYKSVITRSRIFQYSTQKRNIPITSKQKSNM